LDQAQRGRLCQYQPPDRRTDAGKVPVGKHPLQFYSLGTPNGVKVTILLEKLLARGYAGAEYDAG
jgi:GSH-dependent disulfide-bond oxidoreductase